MDPELCRLPAAPFSLAATLHNVYFVQYDVPVSFLAQVLETGAYFVSQVLDTGS